MKSLARPILFCTFLAAVANAATLVDRGLPNGNTVNNIAGVNRSNVDWAGAPAPNSPPPFLVGDNFTLPGGFPTYNVTSIMVFITAATANTSNITTEFNNFTLYGGLDSNPAAFGIIPVLSTFFTRVYYPGAGNNLDPCNTASGAQYQASSGNCRAIFSVNFIVNLVLNANAVYNFAVGANSLLGTCDSANPGNCLFLHASNATLSGNTQQGSNNQYQVWDPFDAASLAAGYFRYNSAANCPANTADVCGGFGNTSSDINVVVQGNGIPEPSTYSLILLGAGLIALRRRK